MNLDNSDMFNHSNQTLDQIHQENERRREHEARKAKEREEKKRHEEQEMPGEPQHKRRRLSHESDDAGEDGLDEFERLVKKR